MDLYNAWNPASFLGGKNSKEMVGFPCPTTWSIRMGDRFIDAGNREIHRRWSRQHRPPTAHQRLTHPQTPAKAVQGGPSRVIAFSRSFACANRSTHSHEPIIPQSKTCA